MSRPRIGIGYDSHRFAEGRRLVLGGVEIPHERGLLGHSDADVLIHAVIDAVLGAMASGDIGFHFPDDDEQYRDAPGVDLLARVGEIAKSRGFKVGNIDAVVITEEPRLAPYIPKMRENIAFTLGIDSGDVSVKGKTNEKLGALGGGEGIAAHAVALLIPE